MATLRDFRPPPRERTFAEVFPWRSIRRAILLVLLIVAIVAIKRSAEPILARVGQMWGPPASRATSSPASPAPERAIHLGPGLAPRSPAPDPGPPSRPPTSQPAR